MCPLGMPKDKKGPAKSDTHVYTVRVATIIFHILRHLEGVTRSDLEWVSRQTIWLQCSLRNAGCTAYWLITVFSNKHEIPFIKRAQNPVHCKAATHCMGLLEASVHVTLVQEGQGKNKGFIHSPWSVTDYQETTCEYKRWMRSTHLLVNPVFMSYVEWFQCCHIGVLNPDVMREEQCEGQCLFLGSQLVSNTVYLPWL